MDDSQSLHRKWLFHQTSIFKRLFGVPGLKSILEHCCSVGFTSAPFSPQFLLFCLIISGWASKRAKSFIRNDSLRAVLLAKCCQQRSQPESLPSLPRLRSFAPCVEKKKNGPKPEAFQSGQWLVNLFLHTSHPPDQDPKQHNPGVQTKCSS